MVLDTKEVVEFFGLLQGSPQFEMDGMVILDTHHRKCIQDFAMGGRDNTNFEHRHDKHGVLGCVFVYFWTLRGSPKVVHPKMGSPRHIGRGIDIIETLHTRFYVGREGCFPLRAETKENGLFLGAFLSVFGL